MGVSESKLIEAIDVATYNDTDVRELFIDLINEDPESFEDCVEDDIPVRPYGPIRENRKRSPNLWLSPWGLMLRSEDIKTPGSYQDRLFRKRFRLPYALFVNLVKEAKQFNIFEETRRGKIAVEFKILIGLRILGRDNCADDISEFLNIGESTINSIFKQFIHGCVKYLYSRYVYIPEGDEMQ